MADEPVIAENINLNNFKSQLIQLKPGESVVVLDKDINLYVTTTTQSITAGKGYNKYTKIYSYSNAVFNQIPSSQNLKPLIFSASYAYDLGMHYYLYISYTNGTLKFNKDCVSKGLNGWADFVFTNTPSPAVEVDDNQGFISTFLASSVEGTACITDTPVELKVEYNPDKLTNSPDKILDKSLIFSLGGTFAYNNTIMQTTVMLSPTYFKVMMPDIQRSCTFTMDSKSVDFGQLDVSKLNDITHGDTVLIKNFSLRVNCTDDNYAHNDSVGVVINKVDNPTVNDDGTINTYIEGKQTGIAIGLKLNGTVINTLCNDTSSCTLYGKKSIDIRTTNVNYNMTATMQKNTKCTTSCISDYKLYVGSNITGVVNLKVILQ
ncbi:MAG: hypothetical protein O2809_04190 [Proteobacteria bacterium]|nr:hypothetical protein [Pseudomonadota bacterium]